MLQHHDAREEQCRGVGKPLARDIRCRAVDGFEDGTLVADVARGREAQTADQARAHIGQDVSVEIRHHEDLVVVGCWIRDDLQAGVVEQLRVELDVGELLGDFSSNVEEEAVGHFHNRGFVHGADFALAYLLGVLEGEAQDPLRGGAGDQLDALHDAVDDDVLDSRVFAFGVFTDEDRVDVVVRGFVASYGDAGADVGEEIECAAEGEVEGDMTFAYGCLGWERWGL